MPAFLLGTNRGVVTMLRPPGGLSASLVSGISIVNCIITRVSMSEQTNQQFLHTLGNFIYVYSFGDRMGEMAISGIAYRNCTHIGHGIGDVRKFYRANKIFPSGRRIFVTVGDQNLVGFLTGFRADTSRPDELLMEFALSFALIPM